MVGNFAAILIDFQTYNCLKVKSNKLLFKRVNNIYCDRSMCISIYVNRVW